jgi:serine/threonine protein phosphatase 1
MKRMWRNLFSRKRGETDGARRRSSVPEGVVLYAVGDIHGQAHLLTSLLARIEEDVSQVEHQRGILVFIGDYVDRGADSRSVVDQVLGGRPGFETIPLRGNHEQMLLDFVSDPQSWEVYRRLGGVETLLSYGVDRELLMPGVAPPRVRDAFLSVFPKTHHEFLRALAFSYDCGDYHFVHAGVRPGVALESQSAEDRLWIRDEFLNAGDVFGSRVIVHGHTPTRDPEVLGFRVGIDTGAYMTGRLTAARFHGADIRFLHS